MSDDEAETVSILGHPVLRIDKRRFLDQIVQKVQAGSPPSYAITANVDILVQAGDDPLLEAALRGATWIVADGVPLIWYSRLRGARIPERVNGTDLCEDLARCCAEHGLRLFLLGGSPRAADGAVAHLRSRHPGVQIVGAYQPPFGEWIDEDRRILAAVEQAAPDVVLVGFGTPLAERWMARCASRSSAAFFVGVGGSFDILSGAYRRAPRWMQRSGLEWAWRLGQDPRRLASRYLVRDPRFAWRAAKELVGSTG